MRAVAVATGLTLAFSLTFVGACASSGPAKKKDTRTDSQKQEDEAKAAIEAGDVAKLKQICEDRHNKGNTIACAGIAQVNHKNGAMDQLFQDCDGNKGYNGSCKFAAELFRKKFPQMAAKCEAIDGLWDPYFSKYIRNGGNYEAAVQTEFLTLYGVRTVTCRNYDALFHKVALENVGPDVFTNLSKKVLPLRESLIAYLEKNPKTPFGVKGGPRAASHAMDAMNKAGKLGDCKDFVKYAKEAEAPLYWAVWGPLFLQTKCLDAAKTFKTLLDSKSAQHRMDGCKWLAEMGAKKMKKAMKKLAKKDKTYLTRDGKKYYQVREACASALSSM